MSRVPRSRSEPGPPGRSGRHRRIEEVRSRSRSRTRTPPCPGAAPEAEPIPVPSRSGSRTPFSGSRAPSVFSEDTRAAARRGDELYLAARFIAAQTDGSGPRPQPAPLAGPSALLQETVSQLSSQLWSVSQPQPKRQPQPIRDWVRMTDSHWWDCVRHNPHDPISSCYLPQSRISDAMDFDDRPPPGITHPGIFSEPASSDWPPPTPPPLPTEWPPPNGEMEWLFHGPQSARNYWTHIPPGGIPGFHRARPLACPMCGCESASLFVCKCDWEWQLGCTCGMLWAKCPPPCGRIRPLGYRLPPFRLDLCSHLTP